VSVDIYKYDIYIS